MTGPDKIRSKLSGAFSVILTGVAAIMLIAALWPGDHKRLDTPKKKPQQKPGAEEQKKTAFATLELPPPPEPDPVEAEAAAVKPLKGVEAKPKPDARPLPVPRRIEPLRPLPKSAPKVALAAGAVEAAKAPPRPNLDRIVKPEPIPAPKPAALVKADKVTAKRGRALLRMLESGAGPEIEIAWPERRLDRDRLFRVLSDCHGMRVAVMSRGRKLYIDEGARGKPWPLNMDRFSSFIRATDRGTAGPERDRFHAINRYHGLNGLGRPVRLFPRQADAVLLGGLSRLIGDGYRTAAGVSARYQLTGEQVRIVDVRVDGVLVGGVIEAPPVSRGRCRA